MTPDNPFAAPSALPYELPPFDRIDEASYRAAFLAGMQAQRSEVHSIATREVPESFENTVVALERSGRLLERVNSVFSNLAQSDGSDSMLALESELAPMLAAHRDAIYLDGALFERVDRLQRRAAELALSPEQRQLLERYHIGFVRAGARLPAQKQQRLRQINERLAALRTRFRQHVLQATRDSGVWVDSAADLAGLSNEQLGAAAEAARERAHPERWLIGLQNTTIQPALAQLHDRALRRKIHEASVSRARGGAADNTAIIAELVRLRAERARLLGFASHAAYVLADENAGSPAAVANVLRAVADAALARARAQQRELQAGIDRQCAAAGQASFALEPWDWHYYLERERQQRYQLDSAALRPYFELERVLHEGVFYMAAQLYGLAFRRRRDLPAYHPDVQVFEVFDAGDAPLGLFLADYYAREGKQGGAWMSHFVTQSTLLGQRPVVANCLNVPRPASGEPTLLSFEEVTTLFHEFGHALHGLLSQVHYPLLAGTNVPRDFVEYPSQFHEMWAREPHILARIARHHASGEPLPAALLERILASQNFNQGYQTTEYLQAALLDQAWHALAPERCPSAAEVMAFETETLAASGALCVGIPPRYLSPYFLHIFADDYSAGYYAYLWSEVLARDTGRWFHDHGGLSRSGGERFRALILSQGWTRDTQQLFRDFNGGPPDIDPLLQYRGLAGEPVSAQLGPASSAASNAGTPAHGGGHR
ncbi:MAG TPA: M3 family metallopeptidase [Steroidobacteraceae bacterium]|jgi:peptidyl-dipeptidase Dcp|nr:M3 family metallopeptidase [Steroidobacteraceae bacterium]